jgi:cytochrome c
MNLETNKIFAAILIAGIFAYLAGFVSELIYHDGHDSVENGYTIDVPETATTGTPADAEPAGPGPIIDLLAEADVEKGKKLSRACAACHTFEKGGANGLGPNLWNVVGRNKASKSDFAYSDAMSAKGGTWSYEDLNQFLYKPKDYVQGTKMNFPGMKKDGNRADMIAWLRTLSDNPQPLP